MDFIGKTLGPEVIKLFSCSTQLSIKFQLLIKTEKDRYFLLLGSHMIFILLIIVKMPTINIYKQDKFHAQLS